MNAYPDSGATTTLVVTNNVVVNTNAGIFFNPQTGTPGGVVQAGFVINMDAGNSDTAIHATLANNIFSNCAGTALIGTVAAGSTLDATCDYNLYDSNGTDVSNVVKGSHSLTDDPLFTDATSGIFSLQSGSPAIDSGDNAAPSLPVLDAAGNDRISDGDGDLVAVVDRGRLNLALQTADPTAQAAVAGAGAGVVFISTVSKQSPLIQ